MRQYQNRDNVYVYYIVSGETLYVLISIMIIIIRTTTTDLYNDIDQ